MSWPRRYWRRGRRYWGYPPPYPLPYSYPPAPQQYGYTPAPPTPWGPPTPEQEIEELEAYKRELETEKQDIEEEIKEIEARINELRNIIGSQGQGQPPP